MRLNPILSGALVALIAVGAGAVAGRTSAPDPVLERIAELESDLAETRAAAGIDVDMLLGALADQTERMADLVTLQNRLDAVGVTDGRDLIDQIDKAGANVEAVELLTRAAQEITRLKAERAALSNQLEHGRVVARDIVIDEVSVAYPLVPPKLMMSVSSFSGSVVQVQVGPKRKMMAVGERLDLIAEGAPCYLVLVESRRERAQFSFGCEAPAEDSIGTVAAPGRTADSPITPNMLVSNGRVINDRF